MGAWGPALYSDDTTCEVRDEYISLLEAGEDCKTATAEIISRYKDVLDDPDVECLVFLALAETQWKYGRLEDKIKTRALGIIDQGGDVEIWRRDCPREAKTREKVLMTLRKKLLSPQLAPRIIKRKTKPKRRVLFNGPAGSVLSVDLRNGYFALLKVVGFFDTETAIEPVFQLISWKGCKLPNQSQIEGIAKHTVPLEKSLNFSVFHLDGRKNPVSFLDPTSLVVRQKEVVYTKSYRGYNVELLIELIETAIGRIKTQPKKSPKRK
jgi:hypothetical protein